MNILKFLSNYRRHRNNGHTVRAAFFMARNGI